MQRAEIFSLTGVVADIRAIKRIAFQLQPKIPPTVPARSKKVQPRQRRLAVFFERQRSFFELFQIGIVLSGDKVQLRLQGVSVQVEREVVEAELLQAFYLQILRKVVHFEDEIDVEGYLVGVYETRYFVKNFIVHWKVDIGEVRVVMLVTSFVHCLEKSRLLE